MAHAFCFVRLQVHFLKSPNDGLVEIFCLFCHVLTASVVQKTEINGRGDPLRWPRDTPLSAKVGTTPTGGGRSVGIVRSRTKATEFSFKFCHVLYVVCENNFDIMYLYVFYP